MAAASTDSIMRGAQHARCGTGVLRAGAAGAACVLIGGGCAALPTQAGMSAWWMSALALAAMMGVPLLMARASSHYSTLKTAATLIVTMCALGTLPAYLNGFQHGHAVAVSMIVAGAVLLFYSQRSKRVAIKAERHADATLAVIHRESPAAAPALLAWLAGLSSGTLARFQLFALCGTSGAQAWWQIALLVATVCALACVADRSRGESQRMLIALYLTRAALIGVLACADNPTLAPLASKLFLLLDCLTIPMLVSGRGAAANSLRAACPGIAHHLGMVTGAALSTSPYFFGDGFVVLFALGAAANLICAVSLAARGLGGSAPRLPTNRYHPEAHASR